MGEKEKTKSELAELAAARRRNRQVNENYLATMISAAMNQARTETERFEIAAAVVMYLPTDSLDLVKKRVGQKMKRGSK